MMSSFDGKLLLLDLTVSLGVCSVEYLFTVRSFVAVILRELLLWEDILTLSKV